MLESLRTKFLSLLLPLILSLMAQSCNIAGDGAIKLQVKPKDKDTPTDPTNVVIASNTSAKSVLVTYTASTDSNFKTHNLKLCTDSNCSTGCVGETTDSASTSYITATADGTYFACVQGVDTVGKKSKFVSSASSTVINSSTFVDPTVEIVANSNYTATKTISVSFTNVINQVCIQEDSNINNCVWSTDITSPNDYTLTSGEGLAKVYLWTKNISGDIVSGSYSDTIILDTISPTAVSNISAPANSTSRTVSLTYSNSADTNFSTHNIKLCTNSGCSTGCDGAVQDTASPTSVTVSSDAQFYACIQGVDLAGNTTSYRPTSATINIDTSAPTVDTAVIDAGATHTADNIVSVSFTYSDAASICIQEDSDVNNCTFSSDVTSPNDLTISSGDNTKTIYIWSKDVAGNITATPRTQTVILDSTNPTAPSGVTIAAGSSSKTVSVSYTDSTDANLAPHNLKFCTNNLCTLGCEGATTDASSPSDVTITTDAVYFACVEGVDQAGRSTGFVASSGTVTIDATLPTVDSVDIDSGANFSTDTTVSVAFTYTEANATHVCIQEDSDVNNCSWSTDLTSPKNLVLSAGENLKTIRVWIKDIANNVNAVAGSDSITLDQTNPAVPSNITMPATSKTKTVAVNYTNGTDTNFASHNLKLCTANDCTTSCTDEVDDASSPGNVTVLSDNTYFACVQSKDSAGQLSSYVVSAASVIIDSTMPSDPANVTVPTSVSSLTVTVTYTNSTDDHFSTHNVKLCTNSDCNTGCSSAVTDPASTTDVTVGANGFYTACVQGKDTFDNLTEFIASAAQVYVFTPDTGWNPEAYIKTNNSNPNDGMGDHIALSGDTLAVSVVSEDSSQTTITNGGSASANNSNDGSGAVYIYKRTGVNWTQEAYIKASNNDSGDKFGASLSLNGDTLAVGATLEDSNITTITNGTTASGNNSNSASGATYIYKRTGSTWVQQAYIKAINSGANDNFGNAVSISGDKLAVGAPEEDSNETTITNGATASADNSLTGSGAVYIYKRNNSTWTQEAFIKAVNAGDSDAFGTSLQLSANTLVVGTNKEDSGDVTITNGTTAASSNTKLSSGAVYVYTYKGTTWAQEAYIKASNSEADDEFGKNVSLSGNTIAVSARYEDSSATTINNGATSSSDNSLSSSGAVYIYKRTAGNFAQESYIKASNSDISDQFGYKVKLNGETLVVGARFEDSSQTTITNSSTALTTDDTISASGAVYVYKRSGTSWEQEAYIKTFNPTAGDYVGKSIDISGDTIVVGVAPEDGNETTITNSNRSAINDSNSDQGGVYVYRNNARLFDVTEIIATTTSSTVTLLFNKTGGSAVGYKYAYKTGSTAPVDCESDNFVNAGNVSTALETGLASATTYTFRVCAYEDGSTITDGGTITVTTD